MKTSIPTRLRQFVECIPAAETIRTRLAEHRRESAFLRRLLKLAVEAELTGESAGGAQAGDDHA